MSNNSKRGTPDGGEEVKGDSKAIKVETAVGVVRKPGPRLPLTMYKEGEPLQLLEHFNAKDGPQTVEVRIPAHCLTSVNRQVRARQLWGSDVYTQDSDLVAVLMHCGFWHSSMSHPHPQVAEVRALVKPQGSKPSYPSTARNNIRSRAWAASVEGCSYSVEKAWVVTRTGTTVDLHPTPPGVTAITPTFTPALLEKITTRSAGQGARQRQIQEVTVVFNLVNEPWPKYNAMAVADRGLKPHEWTSARLRSSVLYLESHSERFELARLEGKELFRFSKCKRILPEKSLRKLGLPLPENERTVLHDQLLWEDVSWGTSAVTIKEEAYNLARVKFIST